MPASKFSDVLPILKDQTAQVGVCAMGPVSKGAELTWMRVWVWQEDGSKVAASAGTSGEHLGGHSPEASEQLPFTADDGWMIQTKLEPGSEPFSRDKPALAMAMALVKHADGTRGIEHWSQAVSIGPAGH
jgi:hypothetical protein